MEWEAVEPPMDEYYDQACQAEYDRISNERSWVNERYSDVDNSVTICFASCI